jgi:arylsulfatase A-like enzyme
MPFNAVHMPPQATEKYLDRFPKVKDQTRRILLAKLSALDDAVGQILTKIREHKLEENTLIVFISDNGGPTASNGSRNDPLSGYKGEVKEGGIREPFMMQWKGHLPAGQVYDKPVISLDIFPTALAAAGAEVPKGVKFDGVNLLPFLTGESDGSPHEVLYWRFGPQWAIREGNYKLRRAEDETSAKLFDVAADVAEKKDLSSEQPEVVTRLRADYGQWNAQLEKPRWIDSRNASTRIRRRPAAATQSDDE